MSTTSTFFEPFVPRRLGVIIPLALVSILIVTSLSTPAMSADNELTPAEKDEGWILLFNGQNLDGWKNNDGSPVAAKVEDGAINVHPTGAYLLVYEEPFGDFLFKCDVKMDQPFCNSGIFLRVGDLDEPVQSGLEVQILSDTKPGLQSFGALYDLVAPSKDASRGPGQWNAFEIRCKGPIVEVTINGEKVTSIDCDEWDRPRRRPDGSRHKFRKAIKDFPREGHIGLQDHGYKAWHKNIKLKKL